MVDRISTGALKGLLEGKTRFALIDVREPGEYNSTHIPGASLISRRQLEFQIGASAPFKGASLVICDDNGTRAGLAAVTLENLGYTNVSVLEGGVNRWTSDDLPTEWGSNVPSKDFGEKMEVVHHVPEIDADDLHRRMERGDKLVILDTRTPEEYQRSCIPGGRSMPGGELAYRITDVAKDLEPGTTVVINCAGRTRSIIGTRVLQRMGVEALGLKNGTSGWVLAGLDLERGGDRLDLPEVSPQGRAAAEEYADRLAKEDGVRYIDVAALEQLIAKKDSETIYFVDVRTDEEYQSGHLPGFRWFPGGQCVQRSDDVAVVKNAPIVFACDGRARATQTASMYSQMGHPEIFVLSGGINAWTAAGRSLESGSPEEPPIGLNEATVQVNMVGPQELQTSSPALTIFVDSSQDFSRSHVPGSRWVPRGSLELQIGALASDKSAPLAVTCAEGMNACFAGATLKQLGYRNVQVLDGGMAAWSKAGLPDETGLSGVIATPTDVVVLGVDRNPAEMMHYLRWETALGEKYAQ